VLPPNNRRGLATANTETRLHVAKAGGDARSHDRDSLRDAGRKGGEIIKAEYGVEFYQTIGEKGGESVKQKYGVDFYREIGEKGEGKIWTYVLQRNRKARRRNSEGRTRK
jgi:general stress protein YciG